MKTYKEITTKKKLNEASSLDGPEGARLIAVLNKIMDSVKALEARVIKLESKVK